MVLFSTTNCLSPRVTSPPWA
ncbi:hypothetical protein E2C01_093643 [Portunus trituberculatus]|uniref:Uncharacterized protein n=1 Tax=Portunus trituberculatus TaxID=210409 RepID=A0A5B7JN89_PORTR|nr:hypothetical protein [Portunus trituberculatus]